jgi:hypothetical protein
LGAKRSGLKPYGQGDGMFLELDLNSGIDTRLENPGTKGAIGHSNPFTSATNSQKTPYHTVGAAVAAKYPGLYATAQDSATSVAATIQSTPTPPKSTQFLPDIRTVNDFASAKAAKPLERVVEPRMKENKLARALD